MFLLFSPNNYSEIDLFWQSRLFFSKQCQVGNTQQDTEDYDRKLAGQSEDITAVVAFMSCLSPAFSLELGCSGAQCRTCQLKDLAI